MRLFQHLLSYFLSFNVLTKLDFFCAVFFFILTTFNLKIKITNFDFHTPRLSQVWNYLHHINNLLKLFKLCYSSSILSWLVRNYFSFKFLQLSNSVKNKIFILYQYLKILIFYFFIYYLVQLFIFYFFYWAPSFRFLCVLFFSSSNFVFSFRTSCCFCLYGRWWPAISNVNCGCFRWWFDMKPVGYVNLEILNHLAWVVMLDLWRIVTTRIESHGKTLNGLSKHFW